MRYKSVCMHLNSYIMFYISIKWILYKNDLIWHLYRTEDRFVGQDFLTLKHYSKDEIETLLWTAMDLKTRLKINKEVIPTLYLYAFIFPNNYKGNFANTWQLYIHFIFSGLQALGWEVFSSHLPEAKHKDKIIIRNRCINWGQLISPKQDHV